MAHYFEDANALIILDWKRAADWFIRELPTERFGKEKRPNCKQWNDTRFYVVGIRDLRAENLVLYEDLGGVVRPRVAVAAFHSSVQPQLF
jgi:hypothetical protein